jgi:hypothetical protein
MPMIYKLMHSVVCIGNFVNTDGLHAIFVDLSVFVSEMWLSAFVPTFFLQVLETSPCRGGGAKIFNFSLHLRFLSCHSRAISSLFSAALGGVVEPCRMVAGSHVGSSPARASPGSHIETSQPSQLSWAARGLVFMYCTCELGIVCTFECVVCNILWLSDIFGHLWYIDLDLWFVYIYVLFVTRKNQKKWLPRVIGKRHSWKAFLK